MQEKLQLLQKKGLKNIVETLGKKDVIKDHNIPIRGGNTKKIDQFDMAGNYIQSFFGSVEVANWLVENGLAKSKSSKRHISECCKKKVKSAYGYIWRYATLP